MNEWKPADEAPPFIDDRESERVLVDVGDRVMIALFTTRGNKGRPGWIVEDDGSWESSDVKRWMPLPPL